MTEQSADTQNRYIMFADVCRSTTLYEQLGDKPALDLVFRALDLASETVRRHSGTVVDVIGDEVLCTFTEPGQALDTANALHAAMDGFSAGLDEPLAFRIGINYGSIMEKADNVYGDSVNVGSRLAGKAKAHQTLISPAVVERAPERFQGQFRDLGDAWIRGKLESIRLIELLEPEPETEITEVVGRELSNDRAFLLILNHNGREFRVNPTIRRFTIGRSNHCDLSLSHTTVSREHAEIQYRNGRFVFIDKSTNGTIIKVNGRPRRAIRANVDLRGEGEILAGHATANRQLVIQFRVD